MTAPDLPEALSGESTLELPEFDAPPADPIALLAQWVADAEARGVREPRAVSVATSRDGLVSSRTVLVKQIDSAGIIFTSHAGSRKGIDLDANPQASINVYWRESLQQISLSGSVSRTDDDESDRLFDERTREARATVAVSNQSAELLDESRLVADATRLAEGTDDIERPQGWGGYRLVPDEIEFWHGRANRLHRRLQYRLRDGRWEWARLQP